MSFGDNARVSVKKALIVSTTPFKYMMQKCEFNKILYLVVSTIDDEITINFETTAIHRDEKNEMVDLYIRSHKAVIRKDEDGEYIISSLDIVDQTCEKVALADITDANKKAITDIVDIAIDDIQKAESKPTYKKKSGGNGDNQKKKFDGDKKLHDNSSSTDYHKNYNIPKDAKFTLDVTSREDRNRKTARRRNKAKSKSRYDY